MAKESKDKAREVKDLREDKTEREKALDDAVRLCRERQYARLPFDPPEMSRIGIPLFHKGRLSGALTCTCLNLTAKEEKGLLNELLKLTGVVLEEPSVENLFLRA